MAIGVVVRNEKGENLTDFVEFLPIVGWEQRSAFPMLTHQDPYGSLILNHLQVRSLLAELNRIEAQIVQLGVIAALELVSSPLISSTSVAPSDLDEVVTSFIRQLRALGETALMKVHRFVWFIGD